MRITFTEILDRIGVAQNLLDEAQKERDGMRVVKAHEVLDGIQSVLARDKMFLPAVTDPIGVALEKLHAYGRPAALDERGKEPHPDDIDDALLEEALRALTAAVAGTQSFIPAL